MSISFLKNKIIDIETNEYIKPYNNYIYLYLFNRQPESDLNSHTASIAKEITSLEKEPDKITYYTLVIDISVLNILVDYNLYTSEISHLIDLIDNFNKNNYIDNNEIKLIAEYNYFIIYLHTIYVLIYYNMYKEIVQKKSIITDIHGSLNLFKGTKLSNDNKIDKIKNVNEIVHSDTYLKYNFDNFVKIIDIYKDISTTLELKSYVDILIPVGNHLNSLIKNLYHLNIYNFIDVDVVNINIIKDVKTILVILNRNFSYATNLYTANNFKIIPTVNFQNEDNKVFYNFITKCMLNLAQAPSEELNIDIIKNNIKKIEELENFVSNNKPFYAMFFGFFSSKEEQFMNFIRKHDCNAQQQAGGSRYEEYVDMVYHGNKRENRIGAILYWCTYTLTFAVYGAFLPWLLEHALEWARFIAIIFVTCHTIALLSGLVHEMAGVAALTLLLAFIAIIYGENAKVENKVNDNNFIYMLNDSTELFVWTDLPKDMTFPEVDYNQNIVFEDEKNSYLIDLKEK